MENQNEIKKASGQLSFRVAPEIRASLEKIAHDKGVTLTEYLRLITEQSVNPKSDFTEKASTKESKSSENTENNIGVFFRELAERADLTNELLAKFVDAGLQEENTETQNKIITEEDLNNSVQQAILAYEEKLRAENLMLRLTEQQRNLLINLLSYRKENGRVNSESIEDLFFFMFKYTFYDTWNKKQESFDEEFKLAFAEKFNS